MIKYNPLLKSNGTQNGALTTAPSGPLVFDLPGKAIWAKGVKLKGTDHTYTFSHDNYITLTNTPGSDESEDIQIGVNITLLKNAIDTTYTTGTLAQLQAGTSTAAQVWTAKILAQYMGSHTHSVTINGSTKTIAAPGGTAVDLGSYLPLSGGTMSLGEGLKFHSDDNYFGTNQDARIISLLDSNDTICDGGLIIDERATLNGVETVTELLRIRHDEFKWKGSIIAHSGNISSSDATLTTSLQTIATIAGVEIKAKITNYNTDENVKQTPKTDNVNRPLMMINGGTSAGEQINTSMFSTGIYANANTNMIVANGFIKNGYDDTSVLLAGGGAKALSDFATSTHNHDGRYARTHWSFASGSDNANVTCTSLDTWVSRLSAVGGISNYGSISSGSWWWVRSTDFQVNDWNIRTSGAMIIYCGDGSFSSGNYKHFLVLDAYADLYGITSNEASWKYYARFLSSRNYTSYVNPRAVSKSMWGGTYIDASGNFQNFAGNFNMSTGDQINMTGADWDGFAFNYASGKSGGQSTRFYNGAQTEIVRFLANGNVGIGCTDPAFKFDVRGDARVLGNLYVGGDASNNFIAFYGNTGDDPGYYQTSFIGEHLWGSPESTELLLMKFNDVGNGTSGTTVYGAGPDRIRHLAHAHVFQIMTSTAQGDFATMAATTACETKFDITRYRINAYVPLHIMGATNDNMGYTTDNPRIIFSENGTQAVGLVYTDWDAYRTSKGLKVMDVDGNDASNVWLEVQGYTYSTGFVKNGSSDSYVLLGGGDHKALSDFSLSNHTHTWPSITQQMQGGNEFNIPDSGYSYNSFYFNYRPRNSRSVNTTLLTDYHFGDLGNGYAYITSNGFKKSSSNDNYVLTGGGGHYSFDNILHGDSYGTMEEVISDCNSVTVTGIYSSSGFNNRPTGVANWGTLFNLRLYNSNNLYHRQLFFDCYNSDKIWTRSDDGGTWTSWKELITSANISPSMLISGDTIAVSVGGVTSNYITVPYSSYTGRFKSHGTTNWDANNLTYPIAENYGQPGGSSNYPGGYGSVFQILASGGSSLGGQFFWSINHNSTSSTQYLYFRAGNNLGWQNDWKRIAWASEIPTVNNASLTLQTAGTTQTTFYANDSTNRTFNVTCANIGAAPSGHDHNGTYLPLAGGTMTGTIITPANDSRGLEPASNNYGQIGSSSKKYYRMYATTFYGSLSGNATTATTANKLAGATSTSNLNATTMNANRLYWHSDSASNAPGSFFGTLLQISNVDSPSNGTNQHWVHQLDFGHDGNLYFRSRINTGDWQSWRKVLDNSNSSASVSGNTLTINLGGTTTTFTAASSSSSGVTISNINLGSTNYYPVMINSTGSKTTLYIANPSSSSYPKFYATSTGVYFTSDINSKTNIQKYITATILENPIRKFNWKSGGKPMVGFIAQEVERWCPEAIDTNEQGYKTLNYNMTLSALCGYLFDEVKKLQEKVEKLQSQLNANKS